ncbi:MAG: YicC family protein [Salibacteraceae bacterium]
MTALTKSMTGFGKSQGEQNGRQIIVEIRTLNSKQADINIRIPSIYREIENDIRTRLANRLYRGKIDLSVQRSLSQRDAQNAINENLAEQYYQSICKLANRLGLDGTQNPAELLSIVLRMPDVCTMPEEDLDESETNLLMQLLDDCIDQVEAFRSAEGATLGVHLKNSCLKITELLGEIEPYEAERIDQIRQRLDPGKINGEAEANSFDQNRYEQEIIYYLEKLDITEEKVRLKSHCDYFLECLGDDGPKGKKLNFIAQEIGREINTLGSKAQHAAMQRIVIQMKEELEKIKEQALNVL